MGGMRTYFGNPVSGHADENLDLSGIGKLIALSDNNDINALASIYFRPEFGLNSIFSLQNKSKDKQLDKNEPVSKHQPSLLFDTEITYKYLKVRIDKVIK